MDPLAQRVHSVLETYFLEEVIRVQTISKRTFSASRSLIVVTALGFSPQLAACAAHDGSVSPAPSNENVQMPGTAPGDGNEPVGGSAPTGADASTGGTDGSPGGSAPDGGSTSANKVPAEVLDLTNWKETLPTGASESPKEVTQPALATFSVSPYFIVNAAGDGVQFRAPTNGVTTSGSGYPRSELREMKNDGKDTASWSTTSGTHTMFIDEAITAVPETKKHIVAGQIHDASDDVIVIRLEFPKLFVDINGTTGPTLDANYVLGTRFTVKFVASGGEINVYYNGDSSPSYTLSTSKSGCYFKAGAYTQSNCDKESSCGSSNYGEVNLYGLEVTHQ